MLRALSLCTCCRHYPGAAAGRIFRSFAQPYQPSPKGSSGRPAHLTFRGLLGVHSRYGLHTRAVTVYRDTLIEGFSHFVTSMTAPIASGWSGCRMGLAPTGKRRLITAHTRSVTSRPPISALRKGHSITSLATASSVAGTERPRALAVLRLMTNSNNVGCSIGRSDGLTPRKILSRKTAVCFMMASKFGP